MKSYEEYLASKSIVFEGAGLEPAEPRPMLMPFQRDIVKWALRKGRACIFADCGLGKTLMQLEWASQIPGKVLILAPLAVAQQTAYREAPKMGIDAGYSRDPCEAKITVTNYQMIDHFDPSDYSGVVLDESSILKSFDGHFRNRIIESFGRTPYRLACTATPAPNDFMELGNHSEFVGSLTRTEMLSTFFVHDGGDTSKWRLKGHAETEFWKWVCSWALMLRRPSDLGYKDGDFVLPELRLHEHAVDVEHCTEGCLFALPAITMDERRKARSASTEERAEDAASIVASKPGEQWIVWCNLNKEAEAATKRIPGAVEVRGSDDPEKKERAVEEFISGRIRVLVSKPSIFGFGLNLQCCHNMVFLGLSDSYEQFYQAVRRCWRFQQTKPVDCYIVTSTQEGEVVRNIQRKEADSMRMAEEMVNNMSEINQQDVRGVVRDRDNYKPHKDRGRDFELYLGDCVDVMKGLESNSIHYSIFSPPFASLYTYSASDRDMGNCRTHGEFYEHFMFAIKELYRLMMPGRLLSFHCMNLPTSKERDGVIGITDFRGDLIRMFRDVGFIYHSEVLIWKDPVTSMQRTKALGLLHKQLKKDSCMSRQGIPDYLVTMRKPGENPERVTHTNESFPVSLWQHYASPVWMDINPSKTLQKESAREHRDERHICPLQLEVIERALQLWTNDGDIVLSPFAGIGSEGHEALRLGRRFVGIELKESYFKQALANLRTMEAMNRGLFEEELHIELPVQEMPAGEGE